MSVVQSVPQPLRIHVQTGPGSVRQETFAHSPITFGRDPACDITVTSRYASREHGELRFNKNRWWLVSKSPNGITLNGRRVGKRARPVGDQDVVTLGDDRLFEVRFAPVTANHPMSDASPVQTDQQAAPAAGRRTKLWGAISIYVVLLLGLFAFLATMGDSPSERTPQARELTISEINGTIRRPLPPRTTPDPRQARVYLLEARELYQRDDARADALYRAYERYRLALAYSGQSVFEEGLDHRQYLDVEDRLVKRVAQLYQDGYAQVRSGQFSQAERTFQELTQTYPDPDSVIFRNAEQQRLVALNQLQRRRR